MPQSWLTLWGINFYRVYTILWKSEPSNKNECVKKKECLPVFILTTFHFHTSVTIHFSCFFFMIWTLNIRMTGWVQIGKMNPLTSHKKDECGMTQIGQGNKFSHQIGFERAWKTSKEEKKKKVWHRKPTSLGILFCAQFKRAACCNVLLHWPWPDSLTKERKKEEMFLNPYFEKASLFYLLHFPEYIAFFLLWVLTGMVCTTDTLFYSKYQSSSEAK